MKGFRIHLVITVLSMVAFASSVFAQSSASASASANANIIPGISITNDTALNFGDFLQPTTGAGTVVLSAASPTVRTIGATVTPAGGAINAAQFTVTGAGTKAFGVTLPGTINITSGANTMAVDQFSSNCPVNVCTFGGAVATSQNFTLFVGGRLSIANNQALGSYTGTFNVNVAYQ